MLRIARAVLSDISSLRAIRSSIDDDSNLEQRIQSDAWFIANLQLKGRGWLCLVDDQAVGYVIADITNSYINSLYVKPQWQRRGIGQSLLRKACGYLFRQGSKRIHLKTSKKSDAYSFYLKRGWHNKSKDQQDISLMAQNLNQISARRSGR